MKKNLTITYIYTYSFIGLFLIAFVFTKPITTTKVNTTTYSSAVNASNSIMK